MDMAIRPRRGGYLRPFGCGIFIRDFLMGKAPFGSPVIDPEVGACQEDIFYHYKQAILRAYAEDAVAYEEEERPKRELPPIPQKRLRRGFAITWSTSPTSSLQPAITVFAATSTGSSNSSGWNLPDMRRLQPYKKFIPQRHQEDATG